LRLGFSVGARKRLECVKPFEPKQKWPLATTTFDGELDSRVPDQALKLFVLLRVEVFSLVQLLLRPLQSIFHGLLVDLLFANRVLGQHVDAIAFDLSEPTADGEQ
jgi:hypothetical protein